MFSGHNTADLQACIFLQVMCNAMDFLDNARVVNAIEAREVEEVRKASKGPLSSKLSWVY